MGGQGEYRLCSVADRVDRARSELECAIRDTRRDPPDRLRRQLVLAISAALAGTERAMELLSAR